MDFKKFANGDWKNDEGAIEAFESYFHAHYEPMLNNLVDSGRSELTEKEKHLLSFLRDDLTKIFKD